MTRRRNKASNSCCKYDFFGQRDMEEAKQKQKVAIQDACNAHTVHIASGLVLILDNGHVTPTVFLAPKRVIYILNSRQNSKKAIEMRIAHTCNGNHISLPILLALVIEVHFHKHQCWKQSASRNASGTRARRNTSPVLQCFDISVLWYNRYEQCSLILIDSF